MTADLNVTELAAQIEEKCTTLETEIAALRTQKKRINDQIKAKQAELDLASSMRPRKRKAKPVTAPTPVAE